METKGGYEIKEFKKLEIPLNRGILKPMIYSGIIFDPNPFINRDIELLWNEDGKCANYSREDCFIKF